MQVDLYVLRTLGGLSLENGGRPIIGAAAQRGRLALLAAIATAGERGISRDRLQALFWAESDTERARGALKQALYSLRRDVGERDLTLGTSEIRLNPAVIKGDIGEFEQALQQQPERAIELYQGPFLDGIHLHDSPEFERWADQERDRLAAAYRGALARLAQTAAKAGDAVAALEWWRKLAVADPMSSSVAVSYMEALIATGQSAAALRHARVYTTLVREELDAAPDPAVSALVDRIRAADTARAAPQRVERSEAAIPVPAALPAAPLPARATSRRKPLLLGAGLLATLLLIGAGSFAALKATRRPLDPHRVALAVATGSPATAPDSLAGLLRDRLTSGIGELQLAPVGTVAAAGLDFTAEATHALARSARARYVVGASYEITGDSVRVSAQLADAEAGLLLPIESLRGTLAMLQPLVSALRDRVMAALAGRVEPRLASWSLAAAMPATYQGVRELRLGIDAFARGDNPEAMVHFRASAALDTTSATPLVWAAYAWAHSPLGATWGDPDFARADSVVKVLEASHRRSGRWDAAVLEEIKAFISGDLAGAHAAGHRVLQAAPNSEWAIMLAYDAYNVGRAREAVELLRKADSKNGWIGGWGGWGLTLHLAYHFLGDFESQLAFARGALSSDPENNGYLQIEVTALGALGRAAEVEQACIASWRHGASVVCDQGIVELRAHGYPDAARRLFQLADRYETNPDSGKTASPLALAGRLAFLGFFAAADSVARAHPLTGPPTAEEARILRDLAVLQGDSAAGALVRRELDSLEAVAGPMHRDQLSFRRAELAGSLGDRDAAVYWLTRAFREGLRHRSFIHWYPAFIKLRGYPPFEAMIRPVDDPERIPPE